MKYWWLWCSWRGWRSFATFHGADCLNCNATRPTWLWYVATRAVSLGPIVGVDCWIAGRDGSVCLTHRFYCLARRLAWTTRTCVSFVVSSLYHFLVWVVCHFAIFVRCQGFDDSIQPGQGPQKHVTCPHPIYTAMLAKPRLTPKQP